MTREVAAGGQCYIITPLVATSTAESFERYKSAEEEFKRLEETYRDVRFGMLHGKMSSEEKKRRAGRVRARGEPRFWWPPPWWRWAWTSRTPKV